MKEIYLTIKTRKYRGDLSLFEYHIYRLYQKFVRNKVENNHKYLSGFGDCPYGNDDCPICYKNKK